jgi:hypothetical protein
MMLANSLKFTSSILITSYKHVGNVQKIEKMNSYTHSSIVFRLVKHFKKKKFSKTWFCLKESEASFEIFLKFVEMDSSKLNNYLVENTPTCYSTMVVNFIKDIHGWGTKKDDLIKKDYQGLF